MSNPFKKKPSAASSDQPDAVALVQDLFDSAVRSRASDVHIEPTSEGYEVRLRVDGLLESTAAYSPAAGRAMVTRLMVLAQLLTYRLDDPQEGGFSALVGPDQRQVEMRLSVIPTSHGLRAVLRMPAELTQPDSLVALHLPDLTLDGIKSFAAADSGMFLLTGPAGLGKTTTIYALLQHIQKLSPGLSIIALEDPVERDLPGVTQIEVKPMTDFSYERVLGSILRQDPQVLMLGEIRDQRTASIAIQATLSGHRLISTLHAGTPGGAVARLLEMGIEPYQIAGSLFGVVAQRLLRRKSPSGGYQGRIPIAEFARINEHARQGILNCNDRHAMDLIVSSEPGYMTLRDAAERWVERGLTDEAEVERVLGSADRA